MKICRPLTTYRAAFCRENFKSHGSDTRSLRFNGFNLSYALIRFLETIKQTPRNRVVLENLTVILLVKLFLAVNEIWMFISVFTRTYLVLDESVHTSLILRTILRLPSCIRLGFSLRFRIVN